MVAVTPRSVGGVLRGFVPTEKAGAWGRATRFGTALFCDVKGFTERTDRHVDAHGRRLGAEVLHGELERTLNGAIETAVAHGGAPVAFAGDAVTFWFEGEASAARAASCALALATFSGDELGLRVSVATGELDRLDVGSAEEGRMQLVGGAAVAQLATLDASGHDGAVLICARTREALEAFRPQTEPARADTWRLRALDDPPTPAVTRDATAALAGVEPIDWVPAPLRSLVRALDAQIAAGMSPDASDLAGLRPLIPLFVHFGGSMTSRPDEIRALVDRVQHEVHSRGGTVLSTNSDAKGSYIAAVFGAPTAHEDDIERAIDTAAALTSGEAGDQVRVGLSRGSALVGLMGLGTRPRYDAIGATMNRAARLMMRAEAGETLLAAEVCEAQAGRYALHPVTGAGGNGACRLGAPTREPASAADEPVHHLLERAEAIERLRHALREAGSGTVVVEGPPGFGKSTLLDAARRETEAEGMLWLRGAGDELARDRALHAMQPVFEALLRHATGTPAQPLLAWAAGQSQKLPESLHGLGGSERAAAMATCLAGLISDIAQRQPVVIALDDGQWIDSVTWTLLLRLMLAGTPVKLIVARRPGAAGTMEGAALLDGPDAARITVGPLSDDAVLRLAAAELGAESLAYDLGRLIVENAGGSPLFTQEIARVLNGRDLLRRDGGHASVATGAERLTRLDFVESLESAILARFDALPRSRKQVARAASVVGGGFSIDALQVAMGERHERGALEDDVDALRRDGYFATAVDGQAGAYSFRHALVREAISESMTFAARARINERLAEWWASRGAAPEAMHRRARYLLEAVRGGKAEPSRLRAAIAALQAAANQASGDYANLEASWLLEDALDLVRRLPDGDESSGLRLEVQSMLAFCLATFRGYGDPTVEDAYRKSLELTADARASEGLAFTLYGLFSFFSSRGDYTEGMRLARRLQRLAWRFDDLRLASVAHQARAIVAVLRGRPAIGARLAAASIADADRMGDRVFSQGGAGDFRIFTGAWLALAEAVRGNADAARAAHARALEQASGEAFAAGFVRSFCPLPVLEGDAEAARDYAAALVADADARGFALFSIIGRVYLGWAQTCLTPGDAEARAMLSQHVQIAQAMKLDSFTPLFLALAAEAHHAAGDDASASAALEAGSAVVARTGGRLFAPELLRVTADLPGSDSAALLADAAAQGRMQDSELFARKAERAALPEIPVSISGAAH